jgi:hypothetical protein
MHRDSLRESAVAQLLVIRPLDKPRTVNWNQKVIKSPLPKWLICVFTILSGIFFCFISIMTFGGYDVRQLITFFILGAFGCVYVWFIYRLAKNQSPWLRRNMRLLVTIGGFIVAMLVLWNMLSKK